MVRKSAKYKVTLTVEKRWESEVLISAGNSAARKLCRARILLKADAGPGGPAWDDGRISEPLEVGRATVSLPVWASGELWQFLRESPQQSLRFISVILPMGLFNLIGALQNLESAEVAGDRYGNRSTLAINGCGTILAACLRSCFPTTI